MTVLSGQKMFPCPVCTEPRELRMTKKRKPYLVCDPCGIQVFVRGPAGIAALNALLERAEVEDLWTRLAQMERRFYLRCSACGRQFWIEPSLIKTSLLDGSLQGFRCPNKDCREVVRWKRESK